MTRRITFFLMLLLMLSGSSAITAFSAVSSIQNETEITATQQPDPTDATEATTPAKREKSIDWFSLIVAGSYLLGVVVLLPLVVYTNVNEKIISEGDPESLSEDDRNDRSAEILEAIEDQLTPFEDDDGNSMITITKGSQARFMKYGLDYINKHLCPTDPELIDRVEEFTQVYHDRADRHFTGSKWILGAALGLVVLMGVIDISMLWSSFMIIHALGIVFYVLSSRTPKYVLEKRMENFGSRKLGIMGAVFAGLFAGFSTRHYVSVNGGAYQRDWESEGNSSIILLFIILVVALFVAFLVAFMGILNFVLNYSTSFLSPLNSPEKWYTKNFGENADERLITMSA